MCIFAKRNSARYVSVSVPYLTVFLFPVKTSWKFMLFVFERNWKREFIIDGTIPFAILYTSIIYTCKFLWWIVISFFSFSICWKSLDLALYVTFGPLSWTLLMKLFDCLEQNIQSNWLQFESDFIIDLYNKTFFP